MNATAMVMVALFPAIVGPLPVTAASALTLELALCNGGSVSIPVEGNGPAVPVTTPCCAKGCHSRRRGQSFDAGQGH